MIDKKTGVRQSNFELMRIVSMFMIVTWHAIVHSGINIHAAGTLRMLIEFLLCFCAVHVNSLVLVSGYFLSEKKEVKIGKTFAILGQAWFYKALIVLIVVFFNYMAVSNVTLIRELLPFDVQNYWFVNCYLVILILSPFLNCLIKNMDQKTYRKAMLLGFLLFSIIPFFTNQQTVTNSGATILQFCFLYFLGGYLKKYPIKENYHFKQYSKSKRQLVFLLGFLIFTIINYVFMNYGGLLQKMENEVVQFLGIMISSNALAYSNPLIVLQTICYFLFFESLNIKSKTINFIAAGTFGIYLIHDNFYVRSFIYNFLGIAPKGTIYGVSHLLQILQAVLFIFIGSLMIEKVRQKITGFIKKTKCFQKLCQRLTKYFSNF